MVVIHRYCILKYDIQISNVELQYTQRELLYSINERSWLFSAIAIGNILGTIPLTWFTNNFGVRKTFTGFYCFETKEKHFFSVRICEWNFDTFTSTVHFGWVHLCFYHENTARSFCRNQFHQSWSNR